MAVTRILFFILATLAGIPTHDATAAPGDLDPGFGTGGVVTSPTATAVFGHSVVALQADGKIVVATDGETTNADLSVVRYDASGVLDPTWGTGGVVTIATSAGNEAAIAIAVQPDGKILAAAAGIDIKVLRFDSTGTLDPTWGSGGTVSTGFTGGGFDGSGDIHLLAGGDVLVGGSFLEDFALARYDGSGIRDMTFGGNGVVTTDVGGIAVLSRITVQPNGKILATGTADGRIVTTRYYDTGVPDPGFGTNGLVVTSAGTSADDRGRDVVVQPDGKILVLGQDDVTEVLAPTLWLVLRYESDGTLDPTWGGTGVVATSVPGPPASSAARSLLLQADGKVIATGESLPDYTVSFDVDLATVRYEADGSLDLSWGGTGIVLSDFGSALEIGSAGVLQADSKLVVAGSYAATASVLVARFEVGEYCGDGLLQAGESCDDGNGQDGDCCSSTCSFESSGASCEDDGDACTADTCDGTGTCGHAAVAEGSSCEDGNACTVGETCTAGLCGGGAPGGVGCVNPFVCYKTKGSKGFPKFGGASNVSLSDDLESGSFNVKNQFELCVPAEVNDVEVRDPTTRQIAYKLTPAPGQPKHEKQKGIVVRDHFGTHSFDTKKPELLLSPADLSLVGPPPAPSPGDADYFKCYKVRLTKGQPTFPRTIATADDEFEDRFYDVYSPRRLCFPVDRDGEGIVDPASLITCYRVRRGHGQAVHEKILGLIHTADGFGDLRIDSNKERDLCLPATLVP